MLGTLREVKKETEVHCLVGTVILGFLSIFKRSQASSPFEALNSVCLSTCQRDVRHPVQMRQRPTDFSRVPHGTQTCLHLVRSKTSLHSSPCKEIRPCLESEHLGIHST